jgi:hypothetical protein
VKRNHRLDIKNFLRAVMWPDAEIGVALEGETVEIADRILQFLGEVGCAVAAARIGRPVRGRLLGLRGGKTDERRGGQEGPPAAPAS